MIRNAVIGFVINRAAWRGTAGAADVVEKWHGMALGGRRETGCGEGCAGGSPSHTQPSRHSASVPVTTNVFSDHMEYSPFLCRCWCSCRHAVHHLSVGTSKRAPPTVAFTHNTHPDTMGEATFGLILEELGREEKLLCSPCGLLRTLRHDTIKERVHVSGLR